MRPSVRLQSTVLAITLAACSGGGGNGSGGNGSGGNGGGGNGSGGNGSGGNGSGGDPTCDASRKPAVPPLGLARVVGDVDELVFAAQPKGSRDWYLVRHTGQIMLFTEGKLESEPFLELREASATADDERGLLGLAFSPNYSTDGTFYVALTTTADNVDRVREYKRSASNAKKADPKRMRELLTLPASAGNHNGGSVLVGPDGLLYVGTGDGGASCGQDQEGAAQNRSSLFGKILRLDPTKPSPYAASGNPFSGSTGDPRVLHYGLRNPFRIGFDREAGSLYIGDVGQNQYEEVSYAAPGEKGLNFGWLPFEGRTPAGMASCPGAPALAKGEVHTPPIFVAERRAAPGASDTPDFEDWVSVIGGVVYRGSAIPALTGAYLFGDYNGNAMAALVQCGSSTSPVATIWKGQNLDEPEDAYFLPQGGAPRLGSLQAIVEDNAGELYLVGNASTLYKVVPN